MMIPKIPIKDAREFHTSAFSVNPQNGTGNSGSSLGASTCKNYSSVKLDVCHRLEFPLSIQVERIS